MSTWTCNCCGEVHAEIPDNFAYDSPTYWGDRSASDPPAGCSLNDDYCVIDGDYFIRGILEIPVHESQEIFGFGVWSSLSKTNFDREISLVDDPKRVEEPPYFGWLSNRIPQYPDTLNLKCNLHTQEPGLRPTIELQPSDHPLAVAQRNGISYARFLELSGQCMHNWTHPQWRTNLEF